MDESVRAALGAGTTVVYDGQWWEVAELDAAQRPAVRRLRALRRVSVSHLLAAPGTRARRGERRLRGAGP